LSVVKVRQNNEIKRLIVVIMIIVEQRILIAKGGKKLTIGIKWMVRKIKKNPRQLPGICG